MILLTALLPIAILVYYIYHKDKKLPEPTRQLVKAFFYGILSVPLSLCISIPLGLIGVYPTEATSILGSISSAFFGAAIPEEIAKFIMLWLLLRKTPYFDEKVDGIVYAVCVSLGFVALENIMYLFSNEEVYLSVGIARAIFAIPGHFCFGMLMGYYYSLAKFYPKTLTKNKALILVAPIIVHGLYDSILFIINVTPAISGILLIVFLIFCHKMWKYGSKSIQEHLKIDLC
ncbi:MAG: PrsW family intramembrane metalloprotease [Alphaproteobacteria bacterium]|nr:PrsW family intramembrane metalloprotease [Alphaproteobacteria bacterium]